MNALRLLTSFFAVLILPLSGQAQGYLEMGAGAGVWHESHVVNADNSRFPIQPYVEYGWILKDYSLTALYDFFSSYQVSNYELNPRFAGFFLNRSFFHQSYRFMELRLMGSAGVLYEFHRFVDKGNANVPGYELEEEKQKGPGVGFRVLVKLSMGNLVVTPQVQLFRSNQEFIAGQFTNQEFQTGSNRLMVSVGYKLNTNGYSKKSCPTYY